MASVIQQDSLFDINLPDTFREVVRNVQHQYSLAEEVLAVLGLQGGSPDGSQRLHGDVKKWYCANWSQHSDGLPYLLYILLESSTSTDVLQLHHDHLTASYYSDKWTFILLTMKYYGPRMPHDVKEYSATSLECQQIKAPNHKKYGELQLLPIPTELWTDIAIDFITRLLLSSHLKGSRKYNAILVVLDRGTKSAGYYLVTSNITAS